MLKKTGLLFCCFLALAFLNFTPVSLAFDRTDLPRGALNTPPMVKEESVSTFVPSESAPGQGLAVNMMFSARPRYKDGAPVLVVVPGGHGPQGLDFDMHAAQQGFVELRFAFPGGGKPGFASSGIYDNRGPKSQEALRDVLRFAAGQITDYQGKNISELLPFHLSNKTIGAVGWSNGGNTLLVTLGKFGDDLPFVSWIAFYESPVGTMFYPPSLGGAQDMMINKHYRQGTAATGKVIVDFRKLAYHAQALKNPGARKKAGEAEMPGIAFFDENQNGTWDESSEFAFPYATDVGFDKQIYPPTVTQALLNLPAFQPPLPDKKKAKPVPPREVPFANYEESLAYFRERDGSQYIKQVIEQHPELAITVFAGRLDHLQRQPDHPHIALLYNTLLAARPKFLRLNPSSAYVGTISFMKPATFAENRPNASIEADIIDQYLEPEGLLPVYAYMEAAVCELSDRVHTNKWIKTLEGQLVNYSNGAKPPEPPDAKGRSKTAPPAKESPAEKPAEKTSPAASSAKAGGKVTESPAPKRKTAPEASSPKDWPFKGNAVPKK